MHVMSRDQVLTRMWHAAGVAMALFFALCSAVQYNDPDPHLWIPVYAAASVTSILPICAPNVQDKGFWTLFCIAQLLYAVALGCLTALNMASIVPPSPNFMNILIYEEGRELAGLLTVTVWLLLGLSRSRLHIESSSSTPKMIQTLFMFVPAMALLPIVMWAVCSVSDLASSISYCKELCSDKT